VVPRPGLFHDRGSWGGQGPTDCYRHYGISWHSLSSAGRKKKCEGGEGKEGEKEGGV